ncbi:predicted protein [Naegleria gruberi]|uniref:Predicted protein n=1 Tax=Naegleria gruberi TaxID=5762 RepID=D2VG01_NAEGR|nr:uncharacterized protein NAEGRDRAFT_67805 [Naegleria gruberi]EFC44275.1 predicted protein [Naegleria gruberi]|eukprot:XP_002677019.1 predicted protein [Naegleria gruberi strain NEG-M]
MGNAKGKINDRNVVSEKKKVDEISNLHETKEDAEENAINVSESPSSPTSPRTDYQLYEHQVFADDILLEIFSYIITDESFIELFKSFVLVGRQWLRIGSSLPIKLSGSKNIENILKCKYLNGVYHLEIWDRNENLPSILGSCKTLRNLRILDIPFNILDSVNIIPFTRNKNFPKLEFLKLNENNLGDKGVISLVNSAVICKNLSELNLTATKFQLLGIQALAKSPHLKKLKKLTISLNRLTNEMVSFFANSQTLTNLTYLDFTSVMQNYNEGNCVKNSLEILCKNPTFSNLMVLKLRDNYISCSDVGDMFSGCKKLTELDLSKNPIKSQTIMKLCESELFKNTLKILNLSEIYFDSQMAKTLGGANSFSLSYLKLTFCKLDCEVVFFLIWRDWTYLTILSEASPSVSYPKPMLPYYRVYLSTHAMHLNKQILKLFLKAEHSQN